MHCGYKMKNFTLLYFTVLSELAAIMLALPPILIPAAGPTLAAVSTN